MYDITFFAVIRFAGVTGNLAPIRKFSPSPYINDLTTECGVCTGKYCLRFFVLCDKNRRQYFLVKTEQTRLDFPFRLCRKD